MWGGVVFVTSFSVIHAFGSEMSWFQSSLDCHMYRTQSMISVQSIFRSVIELKVTSIHSSVLLCGQLLP